MGRHKRKYFSDDSSEDSDGSSSRSLYKRVKRLERLLHKSKIDSKRDAPSSSRCHSRGRDQRSERTESPSHRKDTAHRRRSDVQSTGKSQSSGRTERSAPSADAIRNRDSVAHNRSSPHPERTHREARVSRTPSDDRLSNNSVSATPDLMSNTVDLDVLSLHPEENLAPEIAALLGDDPNNVHVCNKEIHEALASRWGHIILNGLSKESIKELCDQYDTPTNLLALKPSLLNPEVLSVLDKQPAIRDAALMENQRLLCKAISALASGISPLLVDSNTQIENKCQLIGDLCNSGRIMCHLFQKLTQNRRSLIVPFLNGDMVEAIKNCPPGEFLFGAELGERIKTAKSLINVSKDIKKSVPKSTFTGASTSKTKPVTFKKNLNGTRPVRQQRRTEPLKGQSSFVKKRSPSPRQRFRSARKH